MTASRLAATFDRLRARGELGLFPYLTAGFPDLKTSLALADTAIEAGADGFEIGVPFSDPLADGATLQRANQQALERGASLDTALGLAAHIRARAPHLPVVLMSYANPIMRRGEEAFVQALLMAGADGAIIPDMPAEESASMDRALARAGLDFVAMLAPTSGETRIRTIGSRARGFIYCVALVGVTGARRSLATNLGTFLETVRAATSVPLVVGFGIARPEHVRSVASFGADGVIVASALVDLIETATDPVAGVREYVRAMKEATRAAAPTTA